MASNPMTVFLACTTALTLLAMLFVLRALRVRPQAAVSRRQTNLRVLRELAADLEREHRRGALSADDYNAARRDLEHRALADAAAPEVSASPARSARGSVWLVSLGLPAAAIALYPLFGTPHAISPGIAATAAAGDAASDQPTQIARLRQHLAGAPNDGRGWVLLARLHMDENRFDEAASAYERALAVSPDRVAKDPLIWCEAADAVAMAQGRVLAGRPAELIERALALDPAHPRALEMAGSAALEAGEYRRASSLWRVLLAQTPAATTEHAQLTTALAKVERLAQFSLPEAPPTR
jgi:cytochrome c-type biogenesis protein CcmH